MRASHRQYFQGRRSHKLRSKVAQLKSDQVRNSVSETAVASRDRTTRSDRSGTSRWRTQMSLSWVSNATREPSRLRPQADRSEYGRARLSILGDAFPAC